MIGKKEGSKMYLLLEVPYGKKLLVPARFLTFVEESLQVVETKGYGKEMTAFPAEETLNVEIINGTCFKTKPEEVEENLREKLKKSEKINSDLYSRNYTLGEEVKKLKIEMEALKGSCPKPAKEEEDKIPF